MPRKNNEPARTPGCHPDRKHLARGMCKPCYDAWYGSVNRDKMNRKARDWAKNNPEKRLATSRKYLYGITKEEADAKLLAQSGLCPICKGPAKHLDHDHRTGAVRSFLCRRCNTGLGCFKDDPTVLRKAADYLEKWNSNVEGVAA